MQAAHDVALVLAGEPQGPAPDLAGPETLFLVPMVRDYVVARGLRKVVVPVPVPGAAGKALMNGALLPAEPGPRGSQTYADWLRRGGAAPA